MATVTKSSKAGTSNSATMTIVSDSLAIGVMFALVLTVLQRAVGFVRGILFCRLMSDQQLGQWSMVWSFLMLLAPLAVLGLPGCFGKYVEHYRGHGQLRSFVARIAIVSGVMTLVLASTIVVFPSWYSWLIFREPDQTGIMLALAAALVVVTGMNFLTSLVESLRQVRLVTIMRFLLGISFATIGCALLVVMDDKTAAATLGYGISCLIASLPAGWFIWKYRGVFVDEGAYLKPSILWQRIAPFAIWLWFSNLFHNLFEVADRYMLIHCSPVNPEVAQGYVGQYHSGRVLPLLLISVAIMLAGLLMPYMSEKWERGNRAAVKLQLNWTIKLVSVGFTLVGLLILLLAPVMFDWFLQGRYNDGLAVLPLTLVYCIWFSQFTLGQDYLWVAEKGKQAFVIVAIGLGLNILLNLLLIPEFGLWGAVWATSLANLANVLMLYAVNHRYGCVTDFGIWMTAGIPLLILLNPWVGLLLTTLLMFVAWKSRWLLSSEEKQQLTVAVKHLTKRWAADPNSPGRP